ncbi:MAG: aspartate carbamoyltransferase [Bacteroidetes bacterium]|nr:MAG: aspartate carbamoyltransferase [Bacteroidota bacterium]
MSALSFKNLLDADQITKQDALNILSLAKEYHEDFLKGKKEWDACRGNILATLFFEPSTRTRFSFEAAMLRLGGLVISLENEETTSIKKGETLSDTARIMSGYADMIVMRHPQEKSVAAFAEYCNVPVINAGDGANQHPTQALVDLYTIFREKGKLENLTIGFMGDLKYSRTVFCLLTVLRHYKNNFIFIAPPSLRISNERKDILSKRGGNSTIKEVENLADVIDDLDILYATRVQGERFATKEEYDAVKDSYCLAKKDLVKAKKDVIIMHPLPRVNEIHPEVDSLPNAKYFEQAANGVFARMALLTLMKK